MYSEILEPSTMTMNRKKLTASYKKRESKLTLEIRENEK